jgi:hypothetical protein
MKGRVALDFGVPWSGVGAVLAGMLHRLAHELDGQLARALKDLRLRGLQSGDERVRDSHLSQRAHVAREARDVAPRLLQRVVDGRRRHGRRRGDRRLTTHALHRPGVRQHVRHAEQRNQPGEVARPPSLSLAHAFQTQSSRVELP